MSIEASSGRQRLASWAIDTVVVLVFAVVVEAVLPTPSAMIYTTIAVVAYFVALPATGFDTIGHLAVGLRVLSLEVDGAPPWVIRATRLAVVAVLAAPCFAGVVASACSMFAHPTASAWQDAATRTTVVKVAPMQFRRAGRPSMPAPAAEDPAR